MHSGKRSEGIVEGAERESNDCALVAVATMVSSWENEGSHNF